MMSAQRSCRLIAAAGAAAFLLAGSPAHAATPVKSVAMRPVGDFTELSIPVPGALLCEHFTVEPGNGKPARIVLDFCDATHAFGQNDFSNLPPCVIRGIRTSQYRVEPQPIVRVVLDLERNATYTVRQDANSVIVAIADAQRPAFAEWQSGRSIAPSPTSSGKPAMAAAEQKAPASVPQVTSKPTVAASDKPATQTAPSKTQSPPPAPTFADAKKSAEPKPQAAAAAKSSSDAKPAAAGQPESPPSQPVPAQVPTDMAQSPGKGPQSSESPADFMARMTPPQTSPTFVPPSEPLVLAPEHFSGKDESATSTDMPMSSAPVQPMPRVTSGTASRQTEAQVFASTGPQVVRSGEGGAAVADDERSLLERLKLKFFGNQRAPRPYTTTGIDPAAVPFDSTADLFGPPSPGQALDRAALLERIREAEQQAAQRFGQGKPLPQEASGRHDVFYDDMGRTDPFEQLLDGLRSGFLTNAVPNVESLRMVGVLHDDYDAMALLEDMEGHSYILREGDPVENGHVVTVQDQRVIFRINDYGWLRNVALQLSPRNADPTKTLGMNTQNRPDRIQYQEEPIPTEGNGE